MQQQQTTVVQTAVSNKQIHTHTHTKSKPDGSGSNNVNLQHAQYNNSLIFHV